MEGGPVPDREATEVLKAGTMDLVKSGQLATTVTLALAVGSV